MTQTLRFLAVLELLTLIGIPLAARALGRLPGAGIAFAKPLAWLLFAWLVWMLGSLGLPNGLPLVLVCLIGLGALALWLHRRRGHAVEPDPFRKRLFVATELVFVVSFLVALVIGSYSPDVWGTERPMDMMLINATLVDSDFPPRDPWLAGEQVNYYYLGQHMAALLVRLTGVEPSEGYNLALAALMALMLSVAFALAATIAEGARRQGVRIRRPLLAGGLCAVLLGLMGSYAAGRAARKAGDLTTFDWFGPSRVIPDTINEFPFFSWIVGDLHAHFIAVPLTLLALAFIVQAGLKGPPRLASVETFCAALAIGWLYAVNSWSWPVTVGMLVLTMLVWLSGPDAEGSRRRALIWTAAVVAGGVVLILPFVVNFDPNVNTANNQGFLILTSEEQREATWTFVKHHLEIEGPLLWLLVAPLVARLLGARQRVKIVVWGLGALALALALLSTRNLGGAMLVAALLAAALAAATTRRLTTSERMLWVFAAGGLACILGAELGTVRDEFAGGELERMNTVFKMGYQAWILFAVFGAVALVAAAEWAPRRIPRFAWGIAAALLIGSSLTYTVAATVAAKRPFRGDSRLDGRQWLNLSAPGEVAAIDWIREETPEDAVVLEAVGEDYSPFGHARISVYTGRQTLLGWPGHEVQWSHDVGNRIAEVETLYKSPDPAAVQALIALYGIDYAVVGPIERTTYGNPQALAQLGREVYAEAGTRVLAFD